MNKLATILMSVLVGLALAACGSTSPSIPGGASEPTTDTMTQPTTDTMTQPTTDTMTQPTTDTMTQPTAASAMGENAQATIDAIQAAANDYYGKSVTVDGDVTQVYNNLAFTVSDTSAASGPLLVITPNGVNLSQGQNVTISGTVEKLDVAQIQQDLGITLDQSLADMAGQPVLIADQVNG